MEKVGNEFVIAESSSADDAAAGAMPAGYGGASVTGFLFDGSGPRLGGRLLGGRCGTGGRGSRGRLHVESSNLGFQGEICGDVRARQPQGAGRAVGVNEVGLKLSKVRLEVDFSKLVQQELERAVVAVGAEELLRWAHEIAVILNRSHLDAVKLCLDSLQHSVKHHREGQVC